jgi:hypothetical protein
MAMTDSPVIYLGLAPNSRCRSVLGDGPKAVAPEHAPSVLISYPYLPRIGDRTRFRIRSWMLDSGAFSAWNSGATIDLDAYTRTCADLLATDPTLAEVVALDDIRSWRTSLQNTERMWAAGVPAMPTYHLGEPEDVLRGYARDYPKIAIGGMAVLRCAAKRRFAEQTFARVWPCAVHGLAVSSRDLALAVPWHSIDSATWELNAAAFGRWRAFGNRRLRIRGGDQDLRVEVEWYRRLEVEMRHRWRQDMTTVTDRLRTAGWRGSAGDSSEGVKTSTFAASDWLTGVALAGATPVDFRGERDAHGT